MRAFTTPGWSALLGVFLVIFGSQAGGASADVRGIHVDVRDADHRR